MYLLYNGQRVDLFSKEKFIDYSLMKMNNSYVSYIYYLPETEWSNYVQVYVKIRLNSCMLQYTEMMCN